MYSLLGARRKTQPPGEQLRSQELPNERAVELQSSVEVACRDKTGLARVSGITLGQDGSSLPKGTINNLAWKGGFVFV